MKQLKKSELILNDDGSLYHLHLKPENISDKIILVGDPGRVSTVSSFFDRIEFSTRNREFITHTGYFKGKRLTVISTGIGPGNIDIVINELDALANIDLSTQMIKDKPSVLYFIRIGTSGALQENIDIDSFLVSEKAIGFDGILNFYSGRDSICDLEFEKELVAHLQWNNMHASPYITDCSQELKSSIAYDMPNGFTITAPGFYGPQGRVLRIGTDDIFLNSKIESFQFNKRHITNYEMECSAIYGLSGLMHHNALTICVIIANRIRGTFSKNYQSILNNLIRIVLERY